MSFKPKFAAFAIATLVAFPAFAEGIMIKDAYARTSGNGAKSGAAFMQIMNHTNEDDRLLNVSSDIAKKVELHTHIEISDGVIAMAIGKYKPVCVKAAKHQVIIFAADNCIKP